MFIPRHASHENSEPPLEKESIGSPADGSALRSVKRTARIASSSLRGSLSWAHAFVVPADGQQKATPEKTSSPFPRMSPALVSARRRHRPGRLLAQRCCIVGFAYVLLGVSYVMLASRVAQGFPVKLQLHRTLRCLVQKCGNHQAFSFRVLQATPNDQVSKAPSFLPPSVSVASEDDDTWSRSGNGVPSSFGLRNRVKTILQQAKDRTGLSNYNTEPQSHLSPGTVVAETASIGGFERNEADLDFSRESRRVAPNGSSDRPSLQLASALFDEYTDDYPGSSVDALLNSDVKSDAPPIGPEPLPFALPALTPEQEQCLQRGERVQEQSKMGREGSGFVVMDIAAPPYVVWECLLDFESYPQNIGTVKRMTEFTNTHLKSSYVEEKPVLPGTGRETRHYGTASITRASFVLSKFHLKIAAIHKYRPHPEGHYMVFTLDRACKNVVMQDAKGIWYTQTIQRPNRTPCTRVWLLCEVKLSPILPSFIVDYAAKRAMPRATTWLPPLAERMAEQWLHEPQRPVATS